MAGCEAVKSHFAQRKIVLFVSDVLRPETVNISTFRHFEAIIS